MTSPTVSVIVPAYQAEEYLDAALASVSSQTTPADEVVVIDDASSDDTASIARRWADRLPITLVEKPVNEGLGAARASGIAASSGDLLALLDSDDVWFPDHLGVMLEQFERRPGLVTAGNLRWWPGDRIDPTPSFELNEVPPAPEQRLEILRRNFLFVGTLFSRDDHDRAGGFSARRKDEDWELWIRMIRQGVEVSTTGCVTVLYRQRSDSLSSLDGCLDDDIDVLRSLDALRDDEAQVVETTLRRLMARRKLLDGYDLARADRIGDARRVWLRAAIEDRSVRWGPGQSGSTSVRALACIAGPRRAVAWRDDRHAPK
ncbi:glycosyltransferase family 2 protein [Ilumatobacter nonamiensis]|uniref:glycosyltransferase family 2 protein n=1 Tax=Ilumatobacter nonamiensis TaxID=467093 RepID=UPI00034947A9|nr:glycosyltransferase family 2 protein [Ilumatobacter nonamiensis]